MQKLMKDYLDELRRQKKRRRKAAIAVVLLVVLVVGTVTSGLTQYGIAMTEDYKCGLEEHKHTDECYEEVLICGHGDADDMQEEDSSQGDNSAKSEEPEQEASEPEEQEVKQQDTAEPKEAQEGHQHTKDCYETEDVLECKLEESEGHTHGEDCYETEKTLICEEEESEGHTHGNECYETDEVLVCEEEHEHSEDCYETEKVLTCKEEESEGHTHGDDCYESESTLTCKEEENEGHTHDEGCYVQEEVLKCGQEESEEEQTESPASEPVPSAPEEETAPEETDDPEADAEQHTHTEECYESQPVCGLEEHEHTDECLIDKTADVEDASVWDAQYADVEWTDSWSEDLVTAARMQIGYRESVDNYQIAEDGSHKGYTRYGEFAGDPYMDWDAAFVNFCMYYAGLSESGLFPDTIDAAQWVEQFTELNEQSEVYLSAPADHVPTEGDLIFFESGEEEEKETRMGIVSSYEEDTNEIQVIEGNSTDEVKENTYDVANDQITAYLKITEIESVYKGNLLRYEDDQVEILVTAIEENAIPDGVELKVVPIVPDNEETKEQYQAIEEQLQEKVSQSTDQEKIASEYVDAEDETFDEFESTISEENEMIESDADNGMENEYPWMDDGTEEEFVEEATCTIAGFLAYDISFVNADGIEVEPSGNVSVSMRYKNAVLPDEIEENTDELYVTVMHLEEDGEGAVKEVVDLAENKQLKEISTTEKNEIKRVEFETSSFSAIVLTWTDSEVTTYSASTSTSTSKAAAKAATMSPPVHHKYIKRNAASDGSTNTYTVSLDVQGKVQTKNVDIILIVDASSSMTHDSNQNANRVQNAVTQLVKDAKASCPDTVTINMGIVEFSTGFDQKGDFDYGSPYNNWYYTSNGTEKAVTGADSDFPATKYGLKSKIPNNAYKKPDKTPDAKTAKKIDNINKLSDTYQYKISGYGVATNWQAGIRQAETLLASRSDKNETYVVFLTDGLPTARYKTGSNTQTQGACSEKYYLNNSVGYTGTDNTNYKKAVSEWNNSTKIANAEGKYVVYVGDDNCKERCKTFATAVGATLKSGNSAKNLGDTFEAILKKITRRAYTNVVIQDTLSDYVEYAYQNVAAENFTVRRINSNGVSKKLTLGTDYTISFSGTNKKTFKVNLLKGGELVY